MSIVTDKKGNQLLELLQGDENELVSNESYRPLTGSLVVVKSEKGFMLLKHKWRQAWEIVGGTIEANETPRECAIRECFEESGYEISDLRFIALIKCSLVAGHYSSESRIDYSALYCCDIQNIKDFQENEEISDLCWHKPGDFIENASEIDVKLLEYYYPKSSPS